MSRDLLTGKFLLMTGISLIMLRLKEPAHSRPYKVTAYPVTPALFCLSCVYLCYSALQYDLAGSLTSIAIVLSGLLVYYARGGNWVRPLSEMTE